MTANGAPFILASASPRRQQLLQSLGARFSVQPAEVDETPIDSEDPTRLALRLARAKAQAIAASNPGVPVLAADTVVSLEGQLLGKPQTAEENVSFIRLLSGREHIVTTGHVLLNGTDSAEEAPHTSVRFREISVSEAQRYAASGEGLDKAGGYGLQGLGGALVDTVCGCHTNVIGLSLPATLRLFDRLGVPVA